MFVEKYVYKTQISWKEREKKVREQFFLYLQMRKEVRNFVSIKNWCFFGHYCKNKAKMVVLKEI